MPSQLLTASVASPIDITADVSAEEWDGFVRGFGGSNGYHLWAWRTIFEQAFGHETVYLAARRDGGLAGILPLVIFRSRVFGSFAVSLPFIDGGGVCAYDAEVARHLVDRARAVAAERGLSHVEMRHEARIFPALPSREHKVGMRMPLETDTKRAWDALDRKVRNQVRKAEKSGLTTRSAGIELVDAFYSVFAVNMRDLGTPVYSKRLFESVLTTLPNSSRVFLVEKGSTVVGGAIGIMFRDTFTVPWASSLREYRADCPNNLLYWRMFEHAIEAGVRTFDFGRSTPGEGTFHFKQQWGAAPLPLYWEYVMVRGGSPPELSPSNPRYKAAIETWKRLPLPITRLLGPHIVRSIP
jgi:FemAB-related protein (PEP-CTERM system-associated)